jgi:signal transduction histidine kinase
LAEAALSVKAAEASRTEFMAIVSHEFRSPLGPILGLTQLLEASCDCNDPARKQMLGQIRESATSLHELVEDLLTITRLDGGAEQGSKYPVDLGLLAETAEGYFRLFSKGRSLTFQKHVPPDPGHINADGVAIKRAIRALISNATRFTPDGGRVTLTVVAEPGWIRLLVEDSGPGIGADMLQRMFKPFVQAEPALTRRNNGAGLGLTLVDRLARSHGGTVTGRNNSPAPGATFELTLPRILPEDEETIP